MPIFAALAGCGAPTGDFGRLDRGVYADAMTATIGPVSPLVLGHGAPFPYTDEEREMRNLAWDLVRPPDREVPGGSLSGLRWWRALPDGWYAGYPAAYAAALWALPVDSHETRYERLLLQVRADAQRLPAFRDAASRVGKADGARLSALDAVAVPAEGRATARGRVEENRAVVAAVCRALGQRIRGYRYALGRLMVETPSTRSVATDAAIDALAWEAGDCGGAIRIAAAAGGGLGAPVRPFVPRSDAAAVPPK